MTVWNDDTVRALTEMNAAGLSAAVIARALGITRNMVVGKCWRMGMRPIKSRGSKKRDRSTQVAIKQAVKKKREKRLVKLAFKKPGRLCFNLGITGRLL